MEINRVHCLFEQSGSFKNYFISKGISAFDYDIENRFNETQYICDLFKEIDNAYNNKESIFDQIHQEDLILCFFPCTRFENQISMFFRGDSYALKNYNEQRKIEYVMNLHNELSLLYSRVCKLFILCYKRGLRLILENPYSTQHYLTRYFPIKPKIIDLDRRKMGDVFAKPTQFWFINCEPKNEICLGDFTPTVTYKIDKTKRGISRSLISPLYVENFIETYIL